MTPLLLALPWLGLILFVRFVVRYPSELPEAPARTGPDASSKAIGTPLVTVIVPARNESHNIERCVRSLAASRYPDFEIVVVDDRSDDDTFAQASAVASASAREIRVLRGADLPEGWLGKPWACRQGARDARGDMLLFTDADTVHGPDLLSRAVAGLAEERADLLTVIGRQLMETFWERLVQPHVFLAMLLRFPAFERTARNDRWREAIANGQFMLFPRSSYEAIGGHEAVRDEVVEDLALAQHVKRAGLALRIRSAEDDLATRMYRSLHDLVQGWSKNLSQGGQQAFPRWMRPVVMPLSILGALAAWIVPSLVLIGSLAAAALGIGGADGALSAEGDGGATAGMLAGVGSSDLLLWSMTVYALSAAGFGWFTDRMRAPARYGLLYPLGSLTTCYILARSWLRGRRVEWKGRSYTLPATSERA